MSSSSSSVPAGTKEWVLLADLANIGKKRLKVLEKMNNNNNNGNQQHEHQLVQTVDAQALEQILSSCSGAAVKEVEQLLAMSRSNSNNNDETEDSMMNNNEDDDSILLSKVLLRYAVLSDAFRREQQANDILTNALETSLKAVEAAKDELNEVRKERDALKHAFSLK